MNAPVRGVPQSMSMFRDASVRELQQFYQKPIAKVSTELVITIVTVIFLALFAIRPTLDTMSSLLKNIDDKKKVDQQLSVKAAALSTLNTAIVPLSDQIVLLDSVVPNVPDLDGLLRRIEFLASGRPIHLSSLQSITVPKDNDPSLKGDPQLSTLSVSISVKGTYADIVEYIRALLTMDRELSITSMTISANKDSATSTTTTPSKTSTGTSPQLQMSLIFQTHYYGVPVEAVAITP